MVRPDLASDPLAGDPLVTRYETGDALAGGYETRDALAGGYAGDALAAAYQTDALAGADALAAPAGDGFAPTTGDSLATYWDATAATDRESAGESRRTAARRDPRPGPVPPRAADTRSAADRPPGTADRRSVTAGGGSAQGRPAGSTRAATRGRPAGTTRPGTGTGQPGRSQRPQPRPTVATGGPPGAGSVAGAGSRRRGASWEEPGRIGPPAPRTRRYGVPGPGGQAPPPPPWTARPTGTVPWAGRSSGGWDDFFTGMGGTSRGGRAPSGADVARAIIEAFRRGRSGR